MHSPVLGVLGSRSALSIATLASLGGGGVCIALEDAALAVNAPAHGLPLAAGESAFLSRLPRGLGAYLALTGGVLGVHELLHVGLARDYVHSRTYLRLRHALDEIQDLGLLSGLLVPSTIATVQVAESMPLDTTLSPAQALVSRRARAGALALHVAIYGQAHEVSAPTALSARLDQIAAVFDRSEAPDFSEKSGSFVGVVAMRLAAMQCDWCAPVIEVEAFLANTPDSAELAFKMEAAEGTGHGLEAWHQPFGAFAPLDSPSNSSKAAPVGSPEAIAAQISAAAAEAAHALHSQPE
ncbi:hypothetical protein T492DRAFT_954488 [Pavlovales sp. CCMP2436]|nr:hypothetical protein T492DRAFT_954488 [Pavlovales sp. CCMP2436]